MALSLPEQLNGLLSTISKYKPVLSEKCQEEIRLSCTTGHAYLEVRTPFRSGVSVFRAFDVPIDRRGKSEKRWEGLVRYCRAASSENVCGGTYSSVCPAKRTVSWNMVLEKVKPFPVVGSLTSRSMVFVVTLARTSTSPFWSF